MKSKKHVSKKKKATKIHMKGINRQRTPENKGCLPGGNISSSLHQRAKPAAGRSTQLMRKAVELSLLYRLFASHYYKSQGNLPITALKTKLSRQDPS